MTEAQRKALEGIRSAWRATGPDEEMFESFRDEVRAVVGPLALGAQFVRWCRQVQPELVAEARKDPESRRTDVLYCRAVAEFLDVVEWEPERLEGCGVEDEAEGMRVVFA